MTPVFDETKSPLTKINITKWARSKFPSAFASLPPLAELVWIVVDDGFILDRKIQRSISRSVHKHLLVVGAHSPGIEVEQDKICAHIHEGESDITFFRVQVLGASKFTLDIVDQLNTVAFLPPFSDVGDEKDPSRALHRMHALIAYYFLTVGNLKQLVRYEKYENAFTRAFQEACEWIENGGQQPAHGISGRIKLKRDGDSEAHDSTAPAPKRVAVHKNKATIKRILGVSVAQEQPMEKRVALGETNTNIVPSPRSNRDIRKDAQGKAQTVPDQIENALLRKEVAALKAEAEELKARLTFERHAYRGLERENEDMKKDLESLQSIQRDALTLCDHEMEARTLEADLESWKVRAGNSEQEVTDLKLEMEALRAAVQSIKGIVMDCESPEA